MLAAAFCPSTDAEARERGLASLLWCQGSGKAHQHGRGQTGPSLGAPDPHQYGHSANQPPGSQPRPAGRSRAAPRGQGFIKHKCVCSGCHTRVCVGGDPARATLKCIWGSGTCHPSPSHPGKSAPYFLFFIIAITAATMSWLGAELLGMAEESASLQCFQSFPYLPPGKVSKNKGCLSLHPIGDAGSLSTLLLGRAATPNTPLKVIF